MNFNFVRYCFEYLDSGSSKDALIACDARLSWSSLLNDVDKLSRALEHQLVDRTRPVVIYGHKQAGFVTTILACLRSGVPYVPIDTSWPSQRVEHIEAAVRPELVVDCTDSPGQHSWSARTVIKPDGTVISGHFAEGARAITAPVSSDVPCYLIFTSGSTGFPKGVPITRGAFGEFSEWLRTDFGLGSDDVFLNHAPFSFDLSLIDLVGALALGATLVLTEGHLQRNPDALVEHARQNGCTVWVSTPSSAKLACRSAAFCEKMLPGLHTFIFSGETLPHGVALELLTRFPRARVFNAYGPTETTVAVTMIEITRAVLETYNPLPVGFARTGTSLRIDSDGEICIAGANVSRGYFENPELTSQRFRRLGTALEFRTGDLGHFEGTLLFCKGRKDGMIKLHGYRIEPIEIDAAVMRADAAVESCTSLPLCRDGAAQRIVSFLTLKTGQEPADSNAFLARLKERAALYLPSYMIPSELLIVDALPYTANQKIDNAALLKRYQQGHLRENK